MNTSPRRHAALLDPHTAVELDIDQIWHLVDDLLDAHGDYILLPLRTADSPPWAQRRR